MSQLMQVARPGRNAVRQAKKAKEIRQVKAAIVWHERERKKRQEVRHERWEAVTNFRRETARYNNKEQRRVSAALGNMREDWRLGPLRPNRAVGEGADKYGALTAEQVQKPIIPIHKQRHKNEDREKQGLEPEYPLVVDGERIYHIARDDRVVVVHGREKGKIGIVQGFNDDTHRVIVKGVNMVCMALILLAFSC
jgi:large subunit ribosomal protein L24